MIRYNPKEACMISDRVMKGSRIMLAYRWEDDGMFEFNDGNPIYGAKPAFISLQEVVHLDKTVEKLLTCLEPGYGAYRNTFDSDWIIYKGKDNDGSFFFAKTIVRNYLNHKVKNGVFNSDLSGNEFRYPEEACITSNRLIEGDMVTAVHCWSIDGVLECETLNDISGASIQLISMAELLNLAPYVKPVIHIRPGSTFVAGDIHSSSTFIANWEIFEIDDIEL